MRIVAVDDLGGLGTKEGAGVLYAWVPPSPIPLLLPWLGVLLLLLLKANRSAQAWLVWLALLAVLAIQIAARRVLDFLPSELLEMFLDVIGALAFGLAAVWLTGQAYGPRHRLLGFLGILGIMAGFGVVTLAVGQTSGSVSEEALRAGVLLAFSVLAVSIALSLGGLCCRRRYRPATLFQWLMLWLLVIPLVLSSPFFVLAAVVSGEAAPWGELLLGILVFAGVSLAALTPFLVLSFAHPFFRRRLQELLRLGGNEGPSVTTPAPIPVPE